MMRHALRVRGMRGLHAVIAASSVAFVVIGTPARAKAATRYVFTTFTGDTGQELSVYTSTDGLNFTLLADTNYAGPTGVLRDPAILKRDGTYFIAYTLQSWTTHSASFAIASSTDLINWSFVAEVPAQLSGASYTWAPDWFEDTDGSTHLIVSIDTVGAASSFRSYEFTATNAALSTWSAPAPIGIGPNYIDTFIVRMAGTYHAFSKNETTKYIEHASALSITGPWAWVGTGDWAGFGAGKEGPALFQLDDGQWRMFMDCYTGCGYLYFRPEHMVCRSSSSRWPVRGRPPWWRASRGDRGRGQGRCGARRKEPTSRGASCRGWQRG
jgi:Glycosyl hydrolases family 43